MNNANAVPAVADPVDPVDLVDLVVIHEHPEWQKPLFEALDRRGVLWAPFDIKSAAFGDHDVPRAKLYFNQASPSAYLRGNTRAVPLGLAYLRNGQRKEANQQIAALSAINTQSAGLAVLNKKLQGLSTAPSVH